MRVCRKTVLEKKFDDEKKEAYCNLDLARLLRLIMHHRILASKGAVASEDLAFEATVYEKLTPVQLHVGICVFVHKPAEMECRYASDTNSRVSIATHQWLLLVMEHFGFPESFFR